MTERHESPLLDALVEAGGTLVDERGGRMVRHYGDPAREYTAAAEAAAVFDRSHRTRLEVSGRAPGQMLGGLLTGSIPTPPERLGEGDVHSGLATYHAVLTPKGKMITDLWALLPGEDESAGIVLDVPTAGHSALLDHLAKFVPPRFARVADVSADTAMISVVGPEAPERLSRLALEGSVEPRALADAPEGVWWRVGAAESAPMVVRTGDVWPPAYSVIGPREALIELWRSLLDVGVQPAGLAVWSTLRVETGRPAFGTDMDDNTIPVEAGIDGRAIDHHKGCYTGQEVIVRIRDRGHVNRYLRQLLLGDVPTPAEGAELHSVDDANKVVGRVTSAVESPRHGGVVALAYVRRGVEVALLDGRRVTVPTEATSA